ncbi:FAD-binding domain-containing protein [Multifurca ochricompacta]|uniref:FAD-binding domain-containing protein n=1 Tax=Multifurca ochricompacta TaxID=376703 RepID=A0AAD4LUD6_9AGAM|nr:FAD-binding domain-containing protein [Multifurca ochricompacta]
MGIMVSRTASLLCLLLLSFVALARAEPHQTRNASNIKNDDATGFGSACALIGKAISNASALSYPLSVQYFSDIAHWASSSTELSACSVEPGTPQDVGSILRILGQTRTPFAVKGGGHSTILGFSSTSGVQISMNRFNSVTVDNATSTVAIGAGLLWDDVYRALDGTGLNVVGGRVPGVGVAGLTLGGGEPLSIQSIGIFWYNHGSEGYSWKTNQFGLAIDNVDSYEMVLPDGRIKVVRPEDEDLWFGLRGGFNNFGIVTKFVLKAHHQGNVWGGFVIFSSQQFDKINTAIVKFQQVQDKKASIIPTYNAFSGSPSLVLLMFYDGPGRPEGIFDDFLAIPNIQSTVRSGSFLEVFSIFPSTNTFGGTRAYFSSVPVLQYSSALLNVIVNETLFWGAKLAQLDLGTIASYDIEPFDAGLFTHSPASQPSAYPPDRSRALFPTNLYFGWTNPAFDGEVANALRESTRMVRNAAVADGQDVQTAAVYGNYALFGTPIEDVYRNNVPRLKEIRQRVDPENVMTLAGGFKF